MSVRAKFMILQLVKIQLAMSSTRQALPSILIILLLVSFAGSIIQVGVTAAPTLSNSGRGSWNYYREITITSGSSLTDYQILIKLDGKTSRKKLLQMGQISGSRM